MHEDDPLAREIGARIVAARAAQELTQEQLAFAAGVSTRTLHALEHGRLRPRVDTVQRVLSVLGMTLEVATRSARRMSDNSEPDTADSG